MHFINFYIVWYSPLINPTLYILDIHLIVKNKVFTFALEKYLYWYIHVYKFRVYTSISLYISKYSCFVKKGAFIFNKLNHNFRTCIFWFFK